MFVSFSLLSDHDEKSLMVWLNGLGITTALDKNAWNVQLEEWNHLCFTFTQSIFTVYWQGDVGIMMETVTIHCVW